MAVSHLTNSVEELWRLVLSEMGIDGHSYNTLSTDPSDILDLIVSDVGGSDLSSATSTDSQMAAAAVNALAPGTASALTMTFSQLLALLVNALQSSTPSPDSPDAASLDFSNPDNSQYASLV